MNAKLIKELQDAGFPFRAFEPIKLEDLIEACGDFPKELLRLVQLEDGRWGASRTDEEYYHGSTPTEAVARLFIALKKK